MPRNLVLLALDGLSQILFWQYRHVMPALWGLAADSVQFRRFYPASTSDFQSFCDVVHGDSAELDHNLVMPAKPGCAAGRPTNLFDVLARKGYAVLGARHGSDCPDHMAENCLGMWPGSCGAFQHHRDYAPFFDSCRAFIRETVKKGGPFALYLSDAVARPDDASSEKEREGGQFHARFEAGFALLDRTVGKVLELLSSMDLMGDTIIAVFGPYGMDPWRHDFQRGRTTGTKPYADICWTPLLIRNEKNKAGISDQLFSTVDLKPTLMAILFPDGPAPAPRTILGGFDLTTGSRQVALSQNAFALLAENRPGCLPRSYAITDGEWRFMVTSNGGIAGEGGMEFFFDERDPGNGRNLLDFFSLDKKGNIAGFSRKDIVHVHFTQSFQPNIINGTVKTFQFLKDILRQIIRFKEQEALPLAGAEGKKHLFPDDVFSLAWRWR